MSKKPRNVNRQYEMRLDEIESRFLLDQLKKRKIELEYQESVVFDKDMAIAGFKAQERRMVEAWIVKIEEGLRR